MFVGCMVHSYSIKFTFHIFLGAPHPILSISDYLVFLFLDTPVFNIFKYLNITLVGVPYFSVGWVC